MGYNIASDLDFFFRLKNFSQNYLYLKEIITVMSSGGASNKSLRNIFISNGEAAKILEKNGLNLPILRIILKLIVKLFLNIKYKLLNK